MRRLPFATSADRALCAAEAAAHLAAGGLIAYPTETVYGFGCALDEKPLERLARLKRRSEFRPFLVLAADAVQVPGLVWTDSGRRLAAAFWPGPLTLVLMADDTLPPQVRGGNDAVAVRMSPHPGVRALLAAHGAPFTSTSANVPGAPAATTADQAEAAARSLDAEAPWLVLDGGTLPASEPSTIVRCAGEKTTVVRMGAVPLARLREIVEDIDG